MGRRTGSSVARSPRLRDRGRDAVIDTHCHLCDRRFDRDREDELERARMAGVRHLIEIGTGLANGGAVARVTPRRKDRRCLVE